MNLSLLWFNERSEFQNLDFFFFELILYYFGIKNLSLYQNTILAMLITNWHLVNFGLFSPVRSTLVYYSLFRSNSIYFIPIRSIWSIQSIWFSSIYFGPFNLLRSCAIHFGPFHPIRSIQSASVQFGLFNLLWFIQSNLAHFGLLWPVRSIWSISDHFGRIRCTYLRMGKNKFGLRVLLIIWVILVTVIISLREWEFE